jgi:hypothetical protein
MWKERDIEGERCRRSERCGGVRSGRCGRSERCGRRKMQKEKDVEERDQEDVEGERSERCERRKM